MSSTSANAEKLLLAAADYLITKLTGRGIDRVKEGGRASSSSASWAENTITTNARE